MKNGPKYLKNLTPIHKQSKYLVLFGKVGGCLGGPVGWDFLSNPSILRPGGPDLLAGRDGLVTWAPDWRPLM